MTNNFWKDLDKIELDKHYNPILWTPRLSPDTLLPHHERFTINLSESYRKFLLDRNSFESISVGSDAYKSEVDVCKPSIDIDKKSALIYIHGGWWQWFNKENFTYIAKPFNEEGITVYIPGYKMAQDWNNSPNPINDIFQQLKLAIAELLKKSIENGMDSVYITGHSAGGHLAAMMAFVDWEAEFGVTKEALKCLKGVIPLSGLYDLRPLVRTFVNDAIHMDEASAKEVSPYYILEQQGSKSTPLPIFLVLPEYDPQEFYRQAREFQYLMHREGNYCDLLFVPKVDHLDMIENFGAKENYVLTQLILDIVFNSQM